MTNPIIDARPSTRWSSRALILAGLCFGVVGSSSCSKKTSPEESAAVVEPEAEAGESPDDPISTFDARLGETGFGEVALKPGMVVSLEDVVDAFAQYDVVEEVGSQDGPDFRLLTIRGGDVPFAYMQMETDAPDKISLFSVEAAGVTDTYGNSVGNTFLELKENRPDIEFSTDHAHTYAFVTGSHIGYELEMRGYSGPDLSAYSEEQITSWTVGRLIWFSRTINGN